MKIIEESTQRFEQDVPTEYDAYKLLCAVPLATSLNYLAVPWAPLINEKRVTHFLKLKLRIKNHGRPCFSICQHVKYQSLIPLLKSLHCTVLFTPHASTTDNFNTVPLPHVAVHGTAPATTKDIIYSFIGTASSYPKLRSDLFSMTHLPGAFLKEREQWHWHYDNGSSDYLQHTEEYRVVLSRSRFSLCPRGFGPSTIRFWESLQAGAIPVLIADAMLLPESFDWTSCILRVKESELHEVPERVAAINPDQEEAMRAQCLLAYEQFSGPNLISPIRHYLAQQLESTSMRDT